MTYACRKPVMRARKPGNSKHFETWSMVTTLWVSSVICDFYLISKYMDSLLRVLKYSVSICIKIESAVPADRPQTGATTLDKPFIKSKQTGSQISEKAAPGP